MGGELITTTIMGANTILKNSVVLYQKKSENSVAVINFDV